MKPSKTIEWLRELVQLPSVNPGGSNYFDPSIHCEKRVTDWLENWAKGRGIHYFRQPVAPDRDNLIMIVEGKGNAPGTQLWEVHQDTVDVPAMTVAPFGGDIRDGKLFGRGACDVKGSMAAMLGALERIRKHPAGQSDRIILACTVDEEHTFLGVQALRGKARGMVRTGIDEDCLPDFAIVAEPSNLGMISSHKGVIRWHVHVKGVACHSSTPEQGSNAVYAAAEIAKTIAQMQAEMRTVASDPISGGSICLTQIIGGSAPNIVPPECTMLLDRRIGLKENPEDAEKELIRAISSLGLDKDIHWNVSTPIIRCPALKASGNEFARARLGPAIQKIMGACETQSVAFGTDASTLAEHGIPSVVFGPGNIQQAHTKDEWIDIEQVEMATEILFQVATHTPANGLALNF